VRLLSQIGLEPLEDLPPLQIEQAQADRSRRPVCCDGFADRAGSVCGLNFGFGENGWTVIGADAKELQPEALRSGGEDAFELVQRINLEKSDGRARAQGLAATGDAGVQLCPRRRFVAAWFARTPRDEVRDLAPVGRGFGRPRLPLASTGFRIGGAGTMRSIDWRRIPEFHRCRRLLPRARLQRRHGPSDARVRASFANGHHETL
jgi:hypothetical protein